MRKVYLLTSLILLLFVGSAPAQTTTFNYRCTKPTTGSRPVAFLWSVCLNDSNVCAFTVTSADSFAAIPMPSRDVAYVRVAARDALGRVGPISVASAPRDPGAPGGCGRPVRY